MREREGLVARVKQMRRASPADPPLAPVEVGDGQDAGQVRSLERRVAHLEHLLEGLQDSVHRESERQERRISDLEARLEPGSLAQELSRDARERGL